MWKQEFNKLCDLVDESEKVSNEIIEILLMDDRELSTIKKYGKLQARKNELHQLILIQESKVETLKGDFN